MLCTDLAEVGKSLACMLNDKSGHTLPRQNFDRILQIKKSDPESIIEKLNC